jgi:CPA2 family monovalent cation:H+ antiporter-2
MVFLASKAGFSPALGAFVMGSLLAETAQSEKIEHLIKPVKDLFGAIFFVSVGMLINLQMLGEYAWPIVLITGVCILGKIITTGSGALLSGNSLKVSLQTGMSLAQIGEFSFIIAALGLAQKVTSDFFYPIIVAVSGVTTFTTPYLTRASEPLYRWIDAHLPEKWRKSLLRYGAEATTISAASDWQQLLKSFLINVLIFSVLLIAIIYVAAMYALPWIQEHVHAELGSLFAAIITLAIMAPLLWGLAVRNEKNEAFARIFAQQKYRSPIWLMRGIKLALCVSFIVFLMDRFFSLQIATYAALLMITFFIAFRRKIQRLYDTMENRFIRNLNDRELQEELNRREAQRINRNESMAPWDAHMTTFDVEPELPFIGKTLAELKWREQIGVNIAMIKRGRITIIGPAGTDHVFPCDKLFIICTDAQEKKMNVLFRNRRIAEADGEDEVDLEKFTIEKKSPFLNKTIRESGLRALINGLIVGIERDGQRILNPESSMQLIEGDVVWVVGEKAKLPELQKGERVEG